MDKNKSDKKVDAKKLSVLGLILRFFAWWFGFAGIYAMTTSCPCCGQVGCPVGAGGAGVVGGVLALGIQNWKKVGVFFHRIKSKKMAIKKKPS